MTYIALVLGIIGFIVVIILRMPEKKIKSTITMSKFGYLLMNYLYIDKKFYDKLLENANKIEIDKLYRFMIREIHKTKDNKEANQKILDLFPEFRLIEFAKTAFLKASSEQKLMMMEEFSDLPFSEILDLLSLIIFGSHPAILKVTAIRSITKKGITQNFIDLLVILYSFPKEFDDDICEIIYNVSHTDPNEMIRDTSVISNENLSLLSERSHSFLLQTNFKQNIAGAYILGYLCVKSAGHFLMERLELCKEKETRIVILKALFKLKDPETASVIYEFINLKKNIDTEVLQEGLQTLNNLGIIGTKFIQKLTESENPMIKIMSQSYSNLQ